MQGVFLETVHVLDRLEVVLERFFYAVLNATLFSATQILKAVFKSAWESL